jgi:hypothetical protein
MGHSMDYFDIRATDQNRGKISAIFGEACDRWSAEAGYDSDIRSYSATFRPAITHAQHSFIVNSDSADYFDDIAPVYPIVAAKSSKTLQKKLAVTGAQLAELRAYKFSGYQLTELARAEFGPTVVLAELVTAPALRAPVAKTTEGKMVTSYLVIRDNRAVKSFATAAEARASALQIMKDDVEGTIRELVVRATVTREGNSDNLIVISRPQVDATLTVKVTFEIPDETKIESYVVGIHYHH